VCLSSAGNTKARCLSDHGPRAASMRLQPPLTIIRSTRLQKLQKRGDRKSSPACPSRSPASAELRGRSATALPLNAAAAAAWSRPRLGPKPAPRCKKVCRRWPRRRFHTFPLDPRTVGCVLQRPRRHTDLRRSSAPGLGGATQWAAPVLRRHRAAGRMPFVRFLDRWHGVLTYPAMQ